VRVVPVLIDGARPPPEARRRTTSSLEPPACHGGPCRHVSRRRGAARRVLEGFAEWHAQPSAATPAPETREPASIRATRRESPSRSGGECAPRPSPDSRSGKTEWFKDWPKGRRWWSFRWVGSDGLAARRRRRMNVEGPQHEVAIASSSGRALRRHGRRIHGVREGGPGTRCPTGCTHTKTRSWRSARTARSRRTRRRRVEDPWPSRPA